MLIRIALVKNKMGVFLGSVFHGTENMKCSLQMMTRLGAGGLLLTEQSPLILSLFKACLIGISITEIEHIHAGV